MKIWRKLLKNEYDDNGEFQNENGKIYLSQFKNEKKWGWIYI